MTWQQKQEIEKQILARYPVRDKEKKCMTLYQRRQELRNIYRKRLLNDHSADNVKQAE